MRCFGLFRLTVLPLFLLALLSASHHASAALSRTICKAECDVRGSIIGSLLEDHESDFTLYLYESNYLIYTKTNKINKEALQETDWWQNARDDEAHYQISLAFPIARGLFGENSVLGASYTQRSFWQLSNHSESSPFRETNYEPQLFLGWFMDDVEIAGLALRDIEIGINHQSNGQSGDQFSDPRGRSRSWNRAYIRLMLQRDNFFVDLKAWTRLHEKADKDDNADITKYMGYHRVKLGYAWGKAVFSTEIRYNWQTGYGSGQLGISYPLSKHVRLYGMAFTGYGESMIDYDYRQTRFGLGLMLNDIF